MKQEIRIFFTALMFYTRIPCPSWVDHSPDYINKATRYFPLIGWIVGGISLLAYWIGTLLFDMPIAIVLSLLAGVMTTGAFHEDGLADTYDGFGGGWTKEKILEIMKDSRIGAYGAIALIFLFALKFYALQNLLTLPYLQENFYILALLFISYHSLARLTAITLVFTGQYSREDETSKSKPIAKAHSWKEVGGAFVFGLIPLLLLSYFNIFTLLVLIPLTILRFYAASYFNRWIDGYTGDCLGAVEQWAELISLLTFLTIWKFT